MTEYDFYPFTDAITKEDDCAVTDCRGMHYCGYCLIPKAELPEEWHGNYDADGLQYLRVHGGITYAKTEGDYAVFGFDCAHAGDEKRSDLRSVPNVLNMAKTMRKLIINYAAKIQDYRAGTVEYRCKILDEINEGISEELGFGAMIDILGGGSKLKGDEE